MIKTILIDANIVIRFLLNDHSTLSPVAKAIFLKAQKGETRIYFDEVILAEVIWTLSSFYKIKKNMIIDQLEKLLSQNWIINPKKNSLIKALTLYRSSNLDYIDCWLFTVSQIQKTALVTFDSDLKKMINKRKSLDPKSN